MKYSIELLKADIMDELEKLAVIEREFLKIEEKISLDSEDMSFYDRGAIGYILHNFYNGCENIFRLIARFFENDLEPNGWHRDLLKRMNMEINGFRPRVIDKELYRLLDDFRAFRHKFRHTYSFELDWEKEQVVARKLPKTFSLLQGQMKLFLRFLDQIENV